MYLRGPIPIYVDGACFNNGRGYQRGGYGVFIEDGDNRNAAVPLDNVDDIEEDTPTNQRAELHALNHGLAIALKSFQRGEGEYFEIVTDSIYAKKCVEVWSNKWEQNGWENVHGNPVANQDIIKLCLQKYKHINALYNKNGLDDIDIIHVPGHSGNYGNEEADRLARIAAKNCDYA